jgi:sugar/nucleoside kinase (ribokinase family)
MSGQYLLVAGPLALDDLPGGNGMIGGAGAYAAMAAAPLATTQLWARAGADLTPTLLGILERRKIDLAGVGHEGVTPRFRNGVFESFGSCLPEVTPINASNVGAIAVVGLPPADGRRALAVAASLSGAGERILLIAPRPDHCETDPAYLKECASAATILIIPLQAALSLTAKSNPLAAAKSLQDHGAKAVVLTAGMLGGLLVYKNIQTTYPAIPVEMVEPTGVGATFVGVLAGWCADEGKSDYNSLKRGVAIASAIAGMCGLGVGPKKLLGCGHREYFERFNTLRRVEKY